jgi:regulatory protein
LQRRGYGERRVAQALAAAGIEADEADAVREQARSGALATALRFAKRRRIGPFAADRPDRVARQKAFAAMIRAGHPVDVVRIVVDCAPGELPQVE